MFKSYQADASLMPLISTCEKFISLLNGKMFNASLPNVTVTIQPDARGTKTQSLGWMTTDQIWTNQETHKSFYEVNLTASSLEGETLEEIITVLAHELVHVYNAMNGVKDTSSNGHFHNQKFKQSCEEHGLICTKTAKYGWSTTVMGEDLLQFVQKNIKDSDKASVALFREKQKCKVNKTRKLFTYQCPCCGVKIRASKAVHISCTDCNEPFELIDSPEKKGDDNN